jgi:transposase
VVSRDGLRVREVSAEEGNRLLRIVRRSSGSVVTWRRAQMVLLSVQGMDVAGIAKVTFTSPDRVREVLNNFSDDGFDSLYPKYAGGRPPTFTLPQRQAIKKIALSRPGDHNLPFSTWSLTKLAEFLVAEGVVDDISHEGLRVLLRKEEVSFQAVKTWKQSTDPDYEVKKNRVLELYDIAEGKGEPGPDDPLVVFSFDEFGPLNLLPRAGKQWAPVIRRTSKGSTESPRRRRIRATYKRTQGVRHLLAALDMNRDKLYGHIKVNKKRTTFLEFCRYLRSLYPPEVRIAIVMDKFQPSSVDQQGRSGRGVGRGEQRRVGVRAHQRLLPQSDRVSLHGVALLRFERHRPPQSRGAELDDPPLHRLAEPAHRQRRTSCYFIARNGCLTRH